MDLARDAYDALSTPAFEEFTDRPRFNVAPSQTVPVVRLDADGRRLLDVVRWGLVPRWSKGEPRVRPINARDDKVLASPMFKGPMARGRCLVPADGFYEWEGARPPKVPYYFRRRDDAPFAFAGLWDAWRPAKDAGPVDTCLHITTAANGLVAPVHDRMPVILHRADYGRWLDPSVAAVEAAALLRPFPAELMAAYAVSTRVNSPRADGPELIEPMAG